MANEKNVSRETTNGGTEIKGNMALANAEVRTTTVTQSGNEVLGTKEKKLYYLIVRTDKGQLIINVGEKTHDEVQKLTE